MFLLSVGNVGCVVAKKCLCFLVVEVIGGRECSVGVYVFVPIVFYVVEFMIATEGFAYVIASDYFVEHVESGCIGVLE